MKYLLFALFLPFIPFFKIEKEPPAKFYYKDNDKITTWAFSNSNDTAIYIKSERYDIFDIKLETKKYQIFYDKKFTLLAVDIEVNKKDKTEKYKRYNREGQLIISYQKMNNNFVNTYYRFYNSGKIRHKQYNDENGNRIGDTTWYESGNFAMLNIIYDKNTSKSQYYFQNGNIKKEIFEGSNNAETRFIIEYDSIYSKPNYFLCRDTSVVEYTEQGEEIGILLYRMTPLDSVTVIKRK